MSAPRITVLMAVHNGAPWIEEAIASIVAQTWRDFEFLILDDASTDETPALLVATRDERVRIIRNESNLGLTASLNLGLALARGEWVARQDADDISDPRRLELQAAFLAAHPPVAAVGSQAWLIDEHGRALGKKDFPLRHAGIWWSLLFDNALAHSAVTFRRAAVLAVGGYDESFRASQDYDLWSRLGERHALANLPERLVTLRIVESSITRTHRQPELIRRIQAAHFARLVPGRAATEEELALIGQFRSRVEVAALERFYALFHQLRHAVQATRSTPRFANDFRRSLALQFERIGYNLLPVSRLLGLREIGRAVITWPPRVLALPWMRIAALALLGEGARKLYERLRERAPR